MRRSLSILCLLLTAHTYVFASFGAATGWDVRPATGSDTNGGAFDGGVTSPGTDESQGSGVAITVTLTGTTTGTGSPAFTSTTHGPGNFVHIASGGGCTPGWYEILSQSGGTATFDHAMGAATDNCVGVIGGSLATVQQACNNNVKYNSVYLQGTATITSAIDCVTAGFNLIGYTTTHSDRGFATITTATNSICSLDLDVNLHPFVIQNISFVTSAGTPGNAVCPGGSNGYPDLTTDNTQFSGGFANCLYGSHAGYYFNRLNVNNMSALSGACGVAIMQDSTGVNDVHILYSYIVGTTGEAIKIFGGPPAVIVRSIICGAHSADIDDNANADASPLIIVESDLCNSATGSNIAISGGAAVFIYENNINYGAAADGIALDVGFVVPTYVYNNAWGNNAGGDVNPSNYGLTTGVGAVTGISNPFVNYGSGNYALSGSTLKAMGFPAEFLGSATMNYMDIGAAQSQGASGSASSTCMSVK